MGGTVIRTPEGGSASVAGSIVCSGAAMPSSVNLTTQGTIDWWYQQIAPSVPQASSAGNQHSKKSGGFIRRSLDSWHKSATGGTEQVSGLAITATEADTTSVSALNVTSPNATTSILFYSGSSGSAGWRFTVPASTTPRTLRIITRCEAVIATLTASLTDGSANPATVTHDTGGSGTTNRQLTVVYNSSGAGDLNVVFQITSAYSTTSPQIGLVTITLGSS